MPVPERHRFNIMFTFFRPGVYLVRSKAGHASGPVGSGIASHPMRAPALSTSCLWSTSSSARAAVRCPRWRERCSTTASRSTGRGRPCCCAWATPKPRSWTATCPSSRPTRPSCMEEYARFVRDAARAVDRREGGGRLTELFAEDALYESTRDSAQIQRTFGVGHFTLHPFVFERLPGFFFHHARPGVRIGHHRFHTSPHTIRTYD